MIILCKIHVFINVEFFRNAVNTLLGRRKQLVLPDYNDQITLGVVGTLIFFTYIILVLKALHAHFWTLIILLFYKVSFFVHFHYFASTLCMYVLCLASLADYFDDKRSPFHFDIMIVLPHIP